MNRKGGEKQEEDSSKSNHHNGDSKVLHFLPRSGIFKTFKFFLSQWAVGFGTTLLVIYLAYNHFHFIPTPRPSSEDSNIVEMSVRLAFALRCSFPMVLMVFAGVVMVGNKRAVSDAVNPFSGNEHIVQVEKGFLNNTLEQFVIGFTVMMIVATFSATPEQLRLLPIYAAVFVMGRVVFLIGLKMNPLYRTAGFASTLGSLYILFGVVVYSLWTKGLLGGLGDQGSTSSLDSVRTEL